MTTPDPELLGEFADRFMGEAGEGVTIRPPKVDEAEDELDAEDEQRP